MMEKYITFITTIWMRFLRRNITDSRSIPYMVKGDWLNMKDKRGPLEYGFLSAKVVGHLEPTYEDQKKSTDYFFKIGIYTQEEYETRVAELKKKYKIEE